MAGVQANPQDLSSSGVSPASTAPSPVTQQQAVISAANSPTPSASPASPMLQIPSTTVTQSLAIPSGSIEGPLSAPPGHKVALLSTTPPGSILVPPRVSPSPKPAAANPRSSPGGSQRDGTQKDAEGQRVIVTTRTPIFVRSYSHAQTTQSSPNQPVAPRMTAASIRPTPTGQVMPTTTGMIQQVRPISGQVIPMQGRPRNAPAGVVRGGGHAGKVRVMTNGPNRLSKAQVLQQARAQIRAQARSPGGLVIREQSPPSRSPPHAIRGQPRIRIPISGTGRGASGSHSPVLITGTPVRAPFFSHRGTLLAYQPGNPRLQAALSGSHLSGVSRASMTTTGQFLVQAQPKPSPGNGQMSPRIAPNQVRHGLVSPTRARMPTSMPNPSHPHHKPILPSPVRTINSHQLLTVAGSQGPPQHSHRPTAQIRAHLPRISPRPPQGPVQAHSHHQVGDASLHSSHDATPINLVTSPKGSPQIHPVDMSSKANLSPSSTTIPVQSISPAPPRSTLRSEGSDSDTSSKNGRFKVTSTATTTSSTNQAPGAGLSYDASEPADVEDVGSALAEQAAEMPREIPRAIVKPHILTHVIDGFIIEESKEPFPVTSGILSEANTAYKNTRPQPQKQKRPAPEPLEEGVMLRCEFCGKMDSPRKFKRSKRFCSMACAKRYNVGCSKRLGLFSPRQPEKPEKTKHKLKLQLKAKPLKGQRGKHGRLTYNVSQPWGQGSQHDNPVHLAPETCSSSSSSTAPSEDMEHGPSSPNVVLSSPSRSSDQSFQYSDESEDLPPGVGRNPSSWSVDHVAMFIRSLPGCGDYADQFLAQEIDGQALMLLKEDHLMTALNMKLGPALKIINKINTLKDK